MSGFFFLFPFTFIVGWPWSQTIRESITKRSLVLTLTNNSIKFDAVIDYKKPIAGMCVCVYQLFFTAKKSPQLKAVRTTYENMKQIFLLSKSNTHTHTCQHDRHQFIHIVRVSFSLSLAALLSIRIEFYCLFLSSTLSTIIAF